MSIFQVEASDFGSFRRYRFHHPETDHGFDIVPEAAANITALRFAGTNVLDGYETPDELRAGKWGKSAILFPFPNRLRDGRYTWLDRDYTFPINSASTNNAIHGFVRHAAFEVAHIELTAEQAAITSRFIADGTNPAYPFAFMLDVIFALTREGEFVAKFVVTNQHHESIPVGLGWHPYFRLTSRVEDHRLQLSPCERIEIDERMIPTGKRAPYEHFQDERLLEDTQLDTCFAALPHESIVRSVLRANGHTLSIAAPREQFPFFQVFTPPMRTSVAIEPMTCNVNAFQNREGLVELPAGQTWTVAFRIKHEANKV